VPDGRKKRGKEKKFKENEKEKKERKRGARAKPSGCALQVFALVRKKLILGRKKGRTSRGKRGGGGGTGGIPLAPTDYCTFSEKERRAKGKKKLGGKGEEKGEDKKKRPCIPIISKLVM